MELIPLFLATAALAVDLFLLVRPAAARNPQVPNWPWQVLGGAVFAATLGVVGYSEKYYFIIKNILGISVGFMLIILSFVLLIFVFTGSKRASQVGGKFAAWLDKLSNREHRIHRWAVLIAAVGILLDIASRVGLIGLEYPL